MEAKELLRKNLETVAADEQHLVERVYEELFSRHPETEPLFGKFSHPSRQQMVRETFMYAIDYLDGAPWVETNLTGMGNKHHAYEVTQEMYGWYLDCVLDVFAEISGSDWNPVLETQWREALLHISDSMRTAGDGAPGAT